MLKRRVLFDWLYVVLWAAFIFYLSSIPNLQSGFEYWIDTVLRKGAHLAVFGFFGLLLYRATHSYRWSLILTLVYAVSDEYHQSLVIGRSGQVIDIFIDLAGAALFIRLWRQIKKLAPRITRS